MAFDEGLSQRIRDLLEGRVEYKEKYMFGGWSCLIHGNMACGVIGDDLCVRVGPDRHAAALKEEYARLFDFTGRPMKGWIMVDAAGVTEEPELSHWVQLGVDFAASLPTK